MKTSNENIIYMGIQYKVDQGILGNLKAAPIINIIEQVKGLNGVTFE